MDEGVSERKDVKNENNNEEKIEATCLDETPPVDMEEGVSERKYDRNEIMTRKKRQNSHMKLVLLIWRKV